MTRPPTAAAGSPDRSRPDVVESLPRALQRSRRDIGGGHSSAALGQQRGQHADGAARLECVPVVPARQQRQRDRIFALFIPAGRRGPTGSADCEIQLDRNSHPAACSAQKPPPLPPITGAAQRASAPRRHSTCGLNLSSKMLQQQYALSAERVIGQARSDGHDPMAPSGHPARPSATSTPDIRCSTGPGPAAAAAAARPTASWSGWPSPRHVAAHHLPAGSRSAARQFACSHEVLVL